jgi:hypothetical protein
MKGILKKILAPFLSLRTAIWLLLIQLLLLLYGAFAMPAQEEFEAINSAALFSWLEKTPPAVTWWLWASVLVLALLALNTLACSIESVMRKRRGRQWLMVVSPQVIHLGFMFMLLAHLLSSAWAAKGVVGASEGMVIALPGEVELKVGAIDMKLSPNGFPLDWRADVEFYSGGKKAKEDFLAPNRPSFYGGFGVYLKNVRLFPVRAALIEVNREPGAVWALVGGVLFTVGTVLLVGLKVMRER